MTGTKVLIPRWGPFTVSVNDWFETSASTLTSYLTKSGYNPFLEWLTLFIKKSEQLNQVDIANYIAALMLMLSVIIIYEEISS